MIKLEIRETRVEEVTILDMSGDITIGDGNVTLRHIIRQLLGEGRDKILLNMEDVRYVDSSGIGELISNFTMITRRGGQLKIINLTQRIKELLVITKLLTVFDVYESEAKALASFQVSQQQQWAPGKEQPYSVGTFGRFSRTSTQPGARRP